MYPFSVIVALCCLLLHLISLPMCLVTTLECLWPRVDLDASKQCFSNGMGSQIAVKIHILILQVWDLFLPCFWVIIQTAAMEEEHVSRETEKRHCLKLLSQISLWNFVEGLSMMEMCVQTFSVYRVDNLGFEIHPRVVMWRICNKSTIRKEEKSNCLSLLFTIYLSI